MKTTRDGYRRLGPSAWLGTDHLLLVSTRFFSENYMRLYRGDIEAIILYSLRQNRDALLVLESVCALVPLGFCSYLWWMSQSGVPAWYAGRLLVPGILFLVAYVAWRVAQPNWACLLSTRTSRAGLVLGRAATQGRRKFEELVAWIGQSQPPLSDVGRLEHRHVGAGDPKASKPFTLVVHGAAFACGMLGWILLAIRSPYLLGLASLALVAYYTLLAAAYPVQRAYQFPFAVKSAAVMSQIVTLVCLAALLSGEPWFPQRSQFLLRDQSLAIFAGISAVIFGLYGLVAMILTATELPSPATASRSVLGLEG